MNFTKFKKIKYCKKCEHIKYMGKHVTKDRKGWGDRKKTLDSRLSWRQTLGLLLGLVSQRVLNVCKALHLVRSRTTILA